MALSGSAGKRNADAIARFHSQMADRARDVSKRDPERRFRIYDKTAQHKLSQLLQQVEKAKGFLDKVEQRKEDGELTEYTAGIESLPAEVVLLLSDFLETLYERASEKGDNFALSRLNVAAESLRVSLEKGLLREREYPEGQEEIVIKRVIQSASEVHSRILQILDTTPHEIGVEAPEFPIAP